MTTTKPDTDASQFDFDDGGSQQSTSVQYTGRGDRRALLDKWGVPQRCLRFIYDE